MKFDSNLFDTFAQIRNQQQNRHAELLAKYESKYKGNQQTPGAGGSTGSKPVTDPQKPPVSDSGQSTTTPLKADFGNMTARQLQQWLQRSLASGKVPAEQESVFKTLIYSATNGEAKNADKLVNFSEKAQEGLQSAMRRKDSSSMLYWAHAVKTMKQYQGEPWQPK